MSDKEINNQSLIRFFANQSITKIVSSTIKHFQKWKITLSGPDSGLKNTWDEICVQIQGEYSFHWDDYEDAIENHLKEEVKKLNEYERFAIWFLSDQGFFFDESEDERSEFTDDDLVGYLKSKIFKEAGNWNNSRIRRYLG